jgi:hypothetical protein
MKLAFRIAGSDALSKLIAQHDPPYRFCHAEVALTQHGVDGSWKCFSAHIDSGTRFEWIDISNAAHWVTIALPRVSGVDQQRVMDWCERHNGLKYDLDGVKAFKLPWRQQDPGKFFCSEVTLSAIQQIGLLDWVEAGCVSPNLLYLLARASFGNSQ